MEGQPRHNKTHEEDPFDGLFGALAEKGEKLGVLPEESEAVDQPQDILPEPPVMPVTQHEFNNEPELATEEDVERVIRDIRGWLSQYEQYQVFINQVIEEGDPRFLSRAQRWSDEIQRNMSQLTFDADLLTKKDFIVEKSNLEDVFSGRKEIALYQLETLKAFKADYEASRAFPQPPEASSQQHETSPTLPERVPLTLEDARKKYAIAQKLYGNVFKGRFFNRKDQKEIGGHVGGEEGQKRYNDIKNQYLSILQQERERKLQELTTTTDIEVNIEDRKRIVEDILGMMREEDALLGKLVREKRDEDRLRTFKNKIWTNKKFAYARMATGAGMAGASLLMPMIAVVRIPLSMLGTFMATDALGERIASRGAMEKWVSQYKGSHGENMSEDMVASFVNGLNPNAIAQELARLKAVQAQTGKKIEDIPQFFFGKNRKIGEAIFKKIQERDFENKRDRVLWEQKEGRSLQDIILENLNKEIEGATLAVEKEQDRARRNKLKQKVAAIGVAGTVGIIGGTRAIEKIDIEGLGRLWERFFGESQFGITNAPDYEDVDSVMNKTGALPEKDPSLAAIEEAFKNPPPVDDSPDVPGGPETVATATETINQGETAGEVALQLLKEKGLPIKDIWDIEVETPKGTMRLGDLGLVHDQDKLQLIEENGSYHFKLINDSKLQFGELPDTDSSPEHSEETLSVLTDPEKTSLYRPPTKFDSIEAFERPLPVYNLQVNLSPIYDRIQNPEASKHILRFTKDVLESEGEKISSEYRLTRLAFDKLVQLQEGELLPKTLHQLQSREVLLLDKMIDNYLESHTLEKLPPENQKAINDLRLFLDVRLGQPISSLNLPEEPVEYRTTYLDELLEREKREMSFRNTNISQSQVQPLVDTQQPQPVAPSLQGLDQPPRLVTQFPPQPPAPSELVAESTPELDEPVQSVESDTPPASSESSSLPSSQETSLGYTSDINETPVTPGFNKVLGGYINSHEGMTEFQDMIPGINSSLYEVIDDKGVFNLESLKDLLEKDTTLTRYQKPEDINSAWNRFEELFVKGDRKDIVGAVNALAEEAQKSTDEGKRKLARDVLKLLRLTMHAGSEKDVSLGGTFMRINRYITSQLQAVELGNMVQQ